MPKNSYRVSHLELTMYKFGIARVKAGFELPDVADIDLLELYGEVVEEVADGLSDPSDFGVV